MAEVPEEVVVAIEAEDRATPSLVGIGRAFILLGANIGYVTRELGIQNPALNQLIGAFQLIGHAIRIVTSLKTIYAAITRLVAVSETQQAAATAGVTAVTGAYTGAATTATMANLGLAASFRALWAAMGPIGWLMLAIGIIGGAAAGYALAGGFAPRTPGIPALGQGPYQEPMVQINIANANMSTKRDIEETVSDMATLWYQQTRKYHH